MPKSDPSPKQPFRGPGHSEHDNTSARRTVLLLGSTGLVSWIVYVGIAWLSRDFAWESPGIERPLLTVMSLFALVFVLYLLQIVIVSRAIRSRGFTVHDSEATTPGLLPVIAVFAVAFRVVLLFSEPIQEVDAYRYLWDGQVLAAGANPYQYSPQQVLAARGDQQLPGDLQRLAALRDSSPSIAGILHRVHYGELTTVYPPVSQLVFAVVSMVTPQAASVATHLIILKVFIVAFDLATLGTVILLLRSVGQPPEMSIVHAWCPLLIKEFANSGHLDSIAVFLTTAALYCAIRGLFPRGTSGSRDEPWIPLPTGHPVRWLFAAVMLLGLGVGAKIYPAVFAPLLILSIWRRIGFSRAAVAGLLLSGLAIAMIWPMLNRHHRPAEMEKSQPAVPVAALQQCRNLIVADRESPPRPPDRESSSATDSQPQEPRLPVEMVLPVTVTAPGSTSDLPPSPPPCPREQPAPVPAPANPQINPDSTGLAAFAVQWQMNDFLFLLIFENLTPDRAADSSRTAWFTVTSSVWREWFVAAVAQRTGLLPKRIPFLATRLLTLAVFGVLALRWAWRGAGCFDSREWLQLAFLTIAWFWLLLPTQNPWYWTWALPLLPFARSRAWLLLSGLTLIYYLRFWCLYHAPESGMFGTRYTGIDFFDFVVSWLEFAPWLGLLALEAFLRHRRKIAVA